MEKSRSTINYGIQAGSINAKAVAAGPGATAINNESGTDAGVLIEQIKNALKQLNVSEDVRAEAVHQLHSIEQAANQQDAPRAKTAFQKFTEKLKQAGVVLKDALEIAQPLTALAKLLGLPLP